MCDIDRPTIEDWLNKKAKAGYSHNSLLDYRKVLSAVFSQAAEWKIWKGENPCWNLKEKIGEAAEVFPAKIPPADGLVKLLDAFEDTCIISAEGARLSVLTSLAIGTRICEVFGLQPRDIHDNAETVRIERDWHRGRLGPTKTPESKRTRQAPGAARELLAYAAARKGDPGRWIHFRTSGS